MTTNLKIQELVADPRDNATPIIIKPFSYVENIPPRKIITIGGMKCYAKGFLSVTGAAGGVGKSSLAIIEELSLVYGLDLLKHLPVDYLEYPALQCGRQRVWSMCLEDDEEEHQRRVNAALKHYKLDPKGLEDWYFVTYKNDSPVTVAMLGRDGWIASPQVETIDSIIKDKQIDVLMVDPFVNSHSVPENDNGAMNKVADIWRSLCQRAGIASNLTHHIRKLGGLSEISSDDLRGAGSLVGAARLVRVLAPMGKDEAARFDIEEERRRFYVWVNPNAKANIVPPANHRHWFHLASVGLENCEGDWESDSIGVIEYWQPPKTIAINPKDAHIALYAATVGKDDKFILDRCKADIRADGWLGLLIGESLSLNIGKDRDAIKKIIEQLDKLNLIFKDNLKDKSYKNRSVFRVNKPTDWDDSDDVL